jgi:predicted anti-sigma-YlaC factor YlaD
MQDTHIIKLLEEKPLTSLNDSEIANAETHVAQCPECKRAYDAACISAALIVARASETTAVQPFFNSRVMAALRERHLSPEEPALIRMWRAAGALASTMVALLVILVAVTIFSPGADPQLQSTTIAISQNIYSPEHVVLEPADPDDDLTYDEVTATMYELEDADGQ